MFNPLVSIIIPTYNRAFFIAETLDNVFSQTYVNWECIIVDDGSTDSTCEILADYCRKDTRFQYHHRPQEFPKGANACRNYGFEISKGEYIQFLDSDDLMSLNKIKKQINAITNNPDVSILTCTYGFFKTAVNNSNIKKNEVYYKNYHKGFDLLNAFGVNGGYFPVHAYLVKREVLDISGKWNTSLLINQDGEYFCRVLLNCFKIIFVKEATVFYRVDSGFNTSTSKSSEKMANRIESWEIINHEIYKKYKVNNSDYVKKAKEIMFKIVLKDHRELIYANSLFFKQQIFKHFIYNNRIAKAIKKTVKYFLK